MNGRDNFFARGEPRKRTDTPRKNEKFIARPHKVTKNGGEFFNRESAGNDKTKGKVFDKKSYRIKKYSNKYKLDQWEQSRRKNVLKKYYKDIKNDPSAGKYKPFNFEQADEHPMDNAPIKTEDDNEFQPPNYVMHPDLLEKLKEEKSDTKELNKSKTMDDSKNTRLNPFMRAKLEMQRLKDDRQASKEAAIKAREEKTRAIEIYKQKKADKFKKLSKRTKSGQPVMKDRMQMLLDAIQKNN